IGHTHNARTWSPSHGQPLSPEGYAALFETLEPRIFAEGGLFDDIVDAGAVDLSRHDAPATLDRDPALTIVASRHPGVFDRHATVRGDRAAGEYRLNPLYEAVPDGERVRLRLAFPNQEYEQEYGASRRYLPDEIAADRRALAELPAPTVPPALADLARR